MPARRLMRSTPAPGVGIVHLGPGAFFRAFNAAYTDEAMAAEGGDWGIRAVSLRSATARDQLLPQDGVYTSVTLSEAGRVARQVGAVVDVMVAGDDTSRTAIVAAMADPAVRIISLTITEKGYGYDPASGGLDMAHPGIAADLTLPGPPRTAAGLIVAALAARKASGAGPLTILSCDNLPSNGAAARAVVLGFARALGTPGLAGWIDAHITFPSTMVDRITPATTDEDVAALAATEGYFDPACVVHEAFRQWVIEDNFAAGRPAWEQAGAQVVSSVQAHELMKLRCLNGTHSTLAYLGYLAGLETIADCAHDPDFAALCRRLWTDEILPTVPQPEGEDLAAYTDALMARYRDRSIRHRTWQIAMDGSQKLPQRLLGTIADTLAAGRIPFGLCLGVAAWMRYAGGVDESGGPIDVRDPMSETLAAAAREADPVAAFLSLEAVFDPGLAANPAFRGALAGAYEGLVQRGARHVVRAYAAR